MNVRCTVHASVSAHAYIHGRTQTHTDAHGHVRVHTTHFVSRGKVSLDPGRIPHTKQLEKDGGDMDAGRREGVIRALVIKLFSSGLGLIRFGDTDRNVSV